MGNQAVTCTGVATLGLGLENLSAVIPQHLLVWSPLSQPPFLCVLGGDGVIHYPGPA